MNYDMSRSLFAPWQDIVMESYPDAEECFYQHCEDGLLDFLLVELSTQEDCDTLQQAIQRVETAIQELQLVRDALIASA